MISVPEQTAFQNEVADDTARILADFGQQTFNLAFEAQRAMFDTILTMNNAAIECAETEVQLATTFFTNIAGARSVGDIAAAWEELGRQQIDTFRQENQRVLHHGQQFLENASRIVPGPSSMGAD